MKRFGGWEPVTTHEYDAAGRLVRSVPETEWDEAEQGWMLALGEYRAGLCGRCGGDLVETTDPAHNEDNPDASHVYREQPPIECFRCRSLQRSQEQYSGKDGVKYPMSLMHLAPLVPNPRRRRR